MTPPQSEGHSGMNADLGTLDLSTLLADLNPQQRAAATHGDGPLLILAGAGTGKTTTLAHRVACLIARGIDPGRILLLTFTRRAAAEMHRRVDAILRRLPAKKGANGFASAGRKIWGGTFHSVATRLLRRHGQLVGLDPEFTILDRSDSEDLLNVVRGELNLAKENVRFPLKGTCLDIYSRAVNVRTKVDKILERDFPWCLQHAEALKQLFEAYVDRKEQQRVLDYDDLLLFWHALVEEPAGADLLRKQFDAVLVDEYQDTNTLQAEILKGMCPDGRGLTVVGDDAQSIYSFRAATVRNILDFPGQFPGTTIVTLEENYRSTQPILDATNQVIALSQERHEKNLFSSRTTGSRPALVCCLDEDEQNEFVISQILAHRERGIDLKKQAVLFRASHHSVTLEVELARRNIPFHKYGGLKFIEAAHVKDLMAFLRFAENPRDLVAGTRVLMLLPGVGQKKARQLLELLAAARGEFRTWREYRPPAATAECWPSFLELMMHLASRTPNDKDVAGQVHLVRKFYRPLLEEKYDHPAARLRDLEQVELASSKFTDRATFLAEITLDPPSSTQELAGEPLLDEDYLVLSTMHSAKGLEWDSVYIIHAADGNIPSDMATGSTADIEEERRLLYVAMTRARHWLYVCHPQRYYFHNRFKSDAHSYAQRTRFIPAELEPYFEVQSASPEGEASQAAGHEAVMTTQDVRRRLKSLLS